MDHKDKLWALSPEKAMEYLHSSEKGLNTAEAEARLKQYGQNKIGDGEKRHGLKIFLSQFANALVLVLIVAAILAYFFGEKTSSIVIISIMFLNAFLGFFQEYKAERALRELRKYVTKKCNVMRDGAMTEIDVTKLVPGDIVYLNLGDVIPADIRLIKAHNLSADESILTGESYPVSKSIGEISREISNPQQIKNSVFMGTSVATGSGYGVVIATGMGTFFGESAAYLKQKVPEADFQKSIKAFSRLLLRVVILMTLFIFAANVILQKPALDSFLFALALAVGITPELLPVIITIALSNGALRMAKQKVIIKKLESTEDLGNIDTLCSDKTGTLTEGKLSIIDYIDLDGKRDNKVMLYGMLCNSYASVRKTFENPIDKAIWESREADIIRPQLREYTILNENIFDFNRKRMSVLVQNSRKTLIVKGAAELLMKVCSHAVVGGKKVALDRKTSSKIYNRIIEYEKSGYRIVALAEKQFSKSEATKHDEKELTLIGMMLFLDPPKQDAKEAIVLFEKLGVNIKILSGDSPVVTEKICNDVGLAITERVVTGEELEKLNEKQLEEYAMKYNVFARVTPEQKFRIVSSLNKEGHVVGFLGDGINDAPALRAADVGISVDTAAGVAKEAADIILLKKSLHAIAAGITEGRKTFRNIIKYIVNTISANYGNMFTVSISSLFMNFIPLLPPQILLTNFLTDIPNLTMSTDNVDKIGLKKPKKWDFKFISKSMVYFGILSSVFDLLLIIPLLYVFNTNVDLFRTAWFVESAISEIIVVFSLRTAYSFYKSKPSFLLVLSSLLTAIVALGITYTSFGATFFQFVRMPLYLLGYTFLVLAAYFISAEIAKRRFYKNFEM